MLVAASCLVAILLLPAAAATAQPATTVPVGASPDPDPLNAGGVVFLGVSAVLFGGALLLYLRHRPRARS
jgi:hypothetical protein